MTRVLASVARTSPLPCRSCLSATPRFGPLALPLFIDKLAASTSTAKRQTLQAVIEAFPVYGKAVVETHANTFWEAFSVEVSDGEESPPSWSAESQRS